MVRSRVGRIEYEGGVVGQNDRTALVFLPGAETVAVSTEGMVMVPAHPRRGTRGVRSHGRRVFKVDRWYDPLTHNWVVQRKDSEGNQMGEADYVYTKGEADELAERYRAPGYRILTWAESMGYKG